MAENNQDVSRTSLSVSIPNAHFDELWAAIPECMKASLMANPYAVVSDRDGGTILLRDFVAMNNSDNIIQS